jgi:TrmH family RNA methyltransferase
MITQAEIKLINSLNLNKNRRKSGYFIVEGPKMINELVLNPHFEIHFIAATKSWISEQHQKFDIHVKEIPDHLLQKLSNFSTANQVLAIVKTPEYQEFIPKVDELYLVLDGIQDPGNLGTIIRTADWFGIEEIICSQDTVDCFNPKVVQATMGSIFRLKCHYLHLAEFLKDQKQPIYGMLLNGKNIYKQDLKKSGFIVVGNESKGISEELKAFISHPIYIPSFEKSKAESLNASIATAIACNEFRRQ